MFPSKKATRAVSLEAESPVSPERSLGHALESFRALTKTLAAVLASVGERGADAEEGLASACQHFADGRVSVRLAANVAAELPRDRFASAFTRDSLVSALRTLEAEADLFAFALQSAKDDAAGGRAFGDWHFIEDAQRRVALWTRALRTCLALTAEVSRG